MIDNSNGLCPGNFELFQKFCCPCSTCNDDNTASENRTQIASDCLFACCFSVFWNVISASMNCKKTPCESSLRIFFGISSFLTTALLLGYFAGPTTAEGIKIALVKNGVLDRLSSTIGGAISYFIIPTVSGTVISTTVSGLLECCGIFGRSCADQCTILNDNIENSFEPNATKDELTELQNSFNKTV